MVIGIILVLVGGLLLLEKLGFLQSTFEFFWPSLMLVLGLILIWRSKLRK